MVTDARMENEAPLIAFAGGGTGGHIYPALAIADALRKSVPNIRILFFGTDRPIDNRIMDETQYDWVRQSIPSISRKPWEWIALIRRFRHAGASCRMRFQSDRPVMVVGTGGMGSVPAMREARRAGIPTSLMNPDVLPGRANRHLAKHADHIFVQWEEAIENFPAGSPVKVTGCPVRSNFHTAKRQDGVERFNLDPDRKTLLVTGASQGARNINLAILECMDFFETVDDWQILHLSGEQDYSVVCDAYQDSPIPSTVIAYTDNMADALAAADLVIARAGASFLAEITATGKASILFPYPYHKDQHQLANARCLERVSATRILNDAIDPAQNGQALQRELKLLMHDDSLRQSMALNAQHLGCPDAADQIAQIILKTVRLHTPVGGCETMEPVC